MWHPKASKQMITPARNMEWQEALTGLGKPCYRWIDTNIGEIVGETWESGGPGSWAAFHRGALVGTFISIEEYGTK